MNSILGIPVTWDMNYKREKKIHFIYNVFYETYMQNYGHGDMICTIFTFTSLNYRRFQASVSVKMNTVSVSVSCTSRCRFHCKYFGDP